MSNRLLANLLSCSAIVLAAPAEAGTVTVTADNHYALFVVRGATVTYVGTNEPDAWGDGGFNWSLPERFSFEFQPRDGILLATWSDDSSAQGLLGQFEIWPGYVLTTRKAGWWTFLAGNDRDDGSARPTVTEAKSVLTRQFRAVQHSIRHGDGPWGLIPGITPQADWIWGSELEPGSGFGETQWFYTVLPDAKTLRCWSSGSGASYLKVCVTQHGNVIALESPSGKEHIAVGDIVEGYVACAKAPGARASRSYYDSAATQGGWAAPYKVTTDPAKVYRKTVDGKLELVQQFSRVPDETALAITLTLYNRSGVILTDVHLDRYADFDIDNTWTGDQFDRNETSVFGWEASSQVSLTNISLRPSATAIHRHGTGWGVDACNVASEPTPTPPGDWAGRVSYDFGTMTPGSSKTVKLVYRVF